MRVLMYTTAFFVLAIGVLAAVFEMKGTMPIPEEFLPLTSGLANTLLWVLVFIALGGLYGVLGKQRAGGLEDRRDRDSRRRPGSKSSRTTAQIPKPQPPQPADDDIFLVTPLEEPEEPEEPE